ncbi:spore-associated protein A [Streptomyces sp. JV178]|nr:spore-associated protein A [Streptomyces sp. JV178]
MNPLSTRAIAVSVTTTAAMGTMIATAPTASAATYNGGCGSGYVVVNSAPVGTAGTVFLTYKSSTGLNCVVTVRNSPGSPTTICEKITPRGDREVSKCEQGVTTWGGPIYAEASGQCVDWRGSIGSATGGKNDTNCN